MIFSSVGTFHIVAPDFNPGREKIKEYDFQFRRNVSYCSAGFNPGGKLKNIVFSSVGTFHIVAPDFNPGEKN